MATSKSYFTRTNYLFLSGDRDLPARSEPDFEFDESDIWNIGRSSSPECRKSSAKSSMTKKKASSPAVARAAPSSLPVNVPDWSKILKQEYKASQRSFGDWDDEEEDDEDGVRVPPHEYLARQTARSGISSFSVHEGVGRTLKGRDLRRVRNAIWEKTGFID